MANEIRVTAGIAVTNGSLKVNVPAETVQVDQTTARGGGPGTVDVGTSEETIGFGDIVPGYVFVKNLDDTNYVEVGFSTGVYGMRFEAGEIAVFPMNGVTIYAKANTANCSVQFISVNT